MTESWITILCPKCGKKNWVNNGDPEDLTVEDVEAVECWYCDHVHLIDDSDIVTDHEPNIERGRMIPDDPWETPKAMR
jgi:hypothetical protein